MNKIILLNGPPGCGKDFGGEIVADVFTDNSCIMKFAHKLKERTHEFYFVEHSEHDAYEDVKDIPSPDFLGLTPRQAYIAMSEKYVKPVHGEEQFGIWLADCMDAYGDGYTFVVTDSGFVPEAEVLVRRFGADNVTLLRIHRDGCNFDNDSRSYIDLSHLGVRCIDVQNPGTPREYQRNLEDALVPLKP